MAFPNRYARHGAAGMAAVWALVGLCTLIEGVLLLSDFGLVGPPRSRDLAYELGAFWPGLLADWQPNYPAQPWLMFGTYSFLHGGLLHLGMNMFTLVSLGRAVIERIGALRFLAVYALSAVGGAAVYAVLSTSGTPMVGASGALFGLAGAILAWLWEDQNTIAQAISVVGRIVLLLIAINVVLYFALSGRLAWETHLGGFLAGWIAGLAFDSGGRR